MTSTARTARYEPVAASTHATQRWKRYSSYAFAATDAVAPLVVQELPKACTASTKPNSTA